MTNTSLIIAIIAIVMTSFAYSETVPISVDQYYVIIPDLDENGAIAKGPNGWARLSKKYDETPMTVNAQTSKEIDAAVIAAVSLFKPTTKNLSGPGYGSVSIVFGSYSSGITYQIGWNVNKGSDIPDYALRLKKLVEHMNISAQQVDAPEPASPAR